MPHKKYQLLTAWMALAVNCLRLPSVLAIESELSIHASPEEVFFVQRIMEFWKDNDAALAAHQIEEFFRLYPQSQFTDSLLLLKGDLLSADDKYEEALACYQKIADAGYQDKAIAHRLDALYQLGHYSTLCQEAHAILSRPDKVAWEEVANFYYGQAQLALAKKSSHPEASKGHYLVAQNALEKVTGVEFRDFAIQSLAEIYAVQSCFEQQANCYLQLMQKFPEKKMQWSLTLALAQRKYSPDTAIQTYMELRNAQNPCAAQANRELLTFLFEQGRHQKIVDEAAEFTHWNSSTQDRLVPLLLGRAHSYLNQHEAAISYLEPLLQPFKTQHVGSLPNGEVNFVKSLLMPLIFGAHALNELSMVEAWANDYERLLGGDDDFGEVLYVLAMTFKNCDHYLRAEGLLDRLLQSYPNFAKRENAVLERALLQFKLREWDKCHQAFTTFLREYPSSSYRQGISAYLVNTSLQRLEEAEKNRELLKPHQERLLMDLELALQNADELSDEQKPAYTLKKCELLYALGRSQEVTSCLSDFLLRFSADPSLYRAHLLLAACYESHKELALFTEQAEKALALKPDLLEKPQLQLNLFVSYLQLAKEAAEGSEAQRRCTGAAAEHLYAHFDAHKKLEPKNLQWLANYYYQQTWPEQREHFALVLQTEQEKQAAMRSLTLYRHLLREWPAEPQQLLCLENDILMHSNLCASLNCPVEQVALLEKLGGVQESHAALPWKWRSRLLFMLGVHYQETAQINLALKTFEKAASQMKSDPLAICAAKLAGIRLSYQLIAPAERILDNPQMIALLKRLKDLQMAKVWAHEPYHLDAALEYATMRASLVPAHEQAEQLRFLLERMQQEVSAEEDIPSKQYHRLRRADSHKGPLYGAYMQLVEGHIALQESKIAAAQGQLMESAAKKELAQTLYESLLRQKLAFSKSLHRAVHTVFEEMESL